MQVWNVVRAARWKCRTQQFAKNSPSRHHCTTLLGYIFATKACIDNRKKLVKQQYLLHMSPQYGELRLTSGWDWFGCLGHPCKFQWVRVLAALLHSTLVVGVSQTLRRWTEGATCMQGRSHRGGRVPHAPYHVPPTSKWQQTFCLRSWLLTSDVALYYSV